MASRICPDVLNDCNPCAGEFPWANLSAELGEPYVFVSPRIIIRNPPLAKNFTQLGCKRWCYSSISQADADACAIAQATECATTLVPEPPIVVDPPIPPTGFPTVSVHANPFTTSFGDSPGVFNLSRTGSLAQPLAVQFTLSGEAQNGVDYDTLPYAVTIDAGDSNVDVIVVPMDTGEIISKTVILTVLGGSNYSPGLMSADTVTIAPLDCGTPSFRVGAYGPALAEEIAALFPNANDSELPEWDGILRKPQGSNNYISNSSCFSIAGKSIEISIATNGQLRDTTSCPSGWIEALPGNPGCFACFFGFTSNTFFTSDVMTIGDGIDSPILFVSQASGVLGSYRIYSFPNCDQSFLGVEAYRIENDVAVFTVGDVLLSVVNL